MKPKHLFRRHDGERFTRVGGTDVYTMDSSRMAKKYEYSYAHLRSLDFADTLEECAPQSDTPCRGEGCGEDE